MLIMFYNTFNENTLKILFSLVYTKTPDDCTKLIWRVCFTAKNAYLVSYIYIIYSISKFVQFVYIPYFSLLSTVPFPY